MADKSPEAIQHRLSRELESIREWLVDNKLSLHLGKTESILFASKRKLAKTNSIKVQCAGKELATRSKVKYLGLTLDQPLNGESIVDSIVQKSNAKLKFLYRQANKVDQETKKLLVSVLIQCHYDYASSAWYSGLSKKSHKRLQISQNKLIRFILDAPARTHVGADEFKRVNMLPVHMRATQLKLNLVFKILKGSSPNFLTQGFNFTNQRHSINTRFSTSSLQIPQINSFGKSSFMYTGIQAWNSLPNDIKCINDLVNF